MSECLLEAGHVISWDPPSNPAESYWHFTGKEGKPSLCGLCGCGGGALHCGILGPRGISGSSGEAYLGGEAIVLTKADR